MVWLDLSGDRNIAEMCAGLGRWTWFRPVIAAVVCLWLGIGPVLACSSLWEAESEYCCGGESVCLLGGCDCGKTGNPRLGDCGGVRSADGANDNAVASSFARHLGLVPIDLPVDTLLPAGLADSGDESRQNLPPSAPDPPPPQTSGAL